MGDSCQYGVCASACLESAESICCETVQCGNGWSCSLTPGECCPLGNQEFCTGAGLCYSPSNGETCCGPTVCPNGQTCANSGDICCASGQTTCASYWWLIAVSTSIHTISTSASAAETSTTISESAPSQTVGTITSSLPRAIPSTGTGTAACFLNPSATSIYRTPSWYTELSADAQSSYSSLYANATSSCKAARASSSLSAGAKGGVAGGAVAGALAIIGIMLFMLRRRAASKNGAGGVGGAETGSNRRSEENEWRDSSRNEGWNNLSSDVGWSLPTVESRCNRSLDLPTAVPEMTMQELPPIIGGARDLREENNGSGPVAYVPYRPQPFPTPLRQISRRPVGSPPPGELAGGRNYHVTQTDRSPSSNSSEVKHSMVSPELLGREVNDKC